MWDAPLDDGGRSDTFYTITHNVTDIIYNTTDTSVMLTGLIPFVYYELRITADNEVSSQDSNVRIRRVTIPTVMTLGGGNACMCVCVCVCVCARARAHAHMCECMVLNQTWKVKQMLQVRVKIFSTRLTTSCGLSKTVYDM